MVDTSDWGGLPDVKIDTGAANLLASGCEAAATSIRSQVSSRRSLTTNALQDFEGHFSEVFEQNQQTANEDGGQIATALDDIAAQIRHLVSIVPDENARRQAAREWKARRDEEKKEVTLGDVMGDEDPPEGPTSPPAPEPVSAQAAQRDTPQPGLGGGGSGTSSARPAELRNFATGISGSNETLDGRPDRLKGYNSDFTAGFDWGTGEPAGVDGAEVYRAFTLYNQLNVADQTWVDTVAQAFEQAGGEGGMVAVSNAALTNSLAAAGLNPDRQDIPATSPRLYGIKPTTGYADDPVNTSTGNFVEPETDLSFTGGCSGLQLTRMYNSFRRDAGAFGPGWSSWTEIGLALDDEAARLTLPDGRVAEFPRRGEGWDRALGESLWLDRDTQADELRVTDNDGGTWRFTRTGVPLSHDRGEGTMVSFVREDGRLVRLEHERGRFLTLRWAGERVAAATASDGRTVTYVYDDSLRLVTASGSLGTRTYRWNESGLVEAVVDADGVVEVENTYDDQGRVKEQRSPHGRVSRYTYLAGNVTEVADSDGTRANTWIHDRRGRLVGLVDSAGNRQSSAYDQHGNVVLLTERDGTVRVREHDARGHVVREVSPSGTDLRFEHDEADRVVRVVTGEGAETRYVYDGASRNPSLMVDAEGGEIRFEWRAGLLAGVVDPTGVEVRLTHDQHGDLVGVTNAAGDSARLERDAAGRVTAAVTPLGHRTTYVHGAAGLTERVDPDGAVWRFEHTDGGRLAAVVDPMGGRSTVEYGAEGEETRRVDALGRSVRHRRDDLGNLASVELPDGSRWRFIHDSLSRLTSTTTPDGQAWTRRYDAVGDLVEMVDPAGDRTSVSTDRGHGTVVARGAAGEVTERFDGLGRRLGIEQADGSAAIATYDRCGRVVEQLDGEGALTRIEWDAGGRPRAVTSPTGEVTRFEYDACGRRSAIVDPLGARTTIEHDADSRPVRVTLPTGEVAWTTYDPCGRPTSGFRPGEGLVRHTYDAAGRVVETRDGVSGLRRFRYDAAGQLVAATNGNGGITRYEHDELGRVVATTDPLGKVTRREFDAMGRCVAETDPLGRTTRAGYDRVGRQAWQEDARGHRTEWRYDEAGQVSSVTLDGRPLARVRRDVRGRTVTVTDTTRPDGREVVHEAEHDRRGQLVRRSRDGQTMRWSHDASGRRTSMTLPDGQRVGYSYDAAGRLAAVDHPLLGRTTMERDASGRVVAATAGGLIQSWTYVDGFLTSHTSTDGGGATTTEVGRDEEGRIRHVVRDGRTTSYDHDAACQVIEARTGGDHVRWRYDADGRIVAESSPAGTRAFSYDAAGQLLAVEGPEGATRHEYDELGRRTRTTYADGRTRDLGWSPTGWLATIVDEGDGDGVRTELHVDATAELASIDGTPVSWDSAAPYAPALAQVGTTPVLALGTVTAVGDTWLPPGWRGSRADGDDVWSVLQATSGAHVTGLPTGVGISLAGQLTLHDLEWLGARVYDAASRGFLSRDPLDPVTGAGWAGNAYSYAGNDPLHALDPTGLKPVSEADLKAANMSWVEKTGQWIEDNTDYIKGGLMVAAGIGALFIPGVGPILGGALISAGADTMIQRWQAGEDGHINWGQVALSGAIGGVAGGAGLAFRASQGGMAALRTTMLTNGGIGAASSEASYLAKNHDNLSWQGAAGAATGGFVGGSLGGAAGPTGGTIASSFGRSTSGFTANASGAVLNFGAGATGSMVNDVVSGNDIDLRRAAITGGVSSGGGYLSGRLAPGNGVNSLNQMSYFGPRTATGAFNFSGRNTQAMWGSGATGGAIGFGGDFIP